MNNDNSAFELVLLDLHYANSNLYVNVFHYRPTKAMYNRFRLECSE